MLDFVIQNIESVELIMGIAATISFAIAYIMRSRFWFFFLQFTGNTLIVLSFVITMSFVAATGYFVATIRMLIFTIFAHKQKEVPWWIVFLVISINVITSITLWNSAFDILLLIGLVLYTLACKIKDGLIMKSCLLVPLLLYAIYAIVCGNWGSILPQCFELLSALVGVMIEIILRKKAKDRASCIKTNKKIDDEIETKINQNIC